MFRSNPFSRMRVVLAATIFLSFSALFAQDSALQDVAAELEADPLNPILVMQQRMLAHKLGEEAPSTRNWRWRQTQTNLQRELIGSQPGRDRQGSLADSAGLLTGQRAIEESLQLGSIGMNRDNADTSGATPASSIEVLEIPSHPWTEMIGDAVVVTPNIADVAPKNMLFVHMQHPSQVLELEQLVERQSEVFGDVYGLATAASLKEKMMRRLGIPNADKFVAAIEEMAFVSDDIAFKPGTDYALILKPVNALAETGFELLVDDKTIYRKVGDFLVVATTEQIIDRVQAAANEPALAMSSQEDFRYALINTEPQRDGLIYLSESFIRKLTGPGYRINSRRRNTVLTALESLQYSVFAYRRITGDWPDSFGQMEREQYIDENRLFDQAAYTIDVDGRVIHDVWGSLWNVKPVNRVPIDTVTNGELDIYKRFSASYQDFFREFFDPIGIAYTISDQLYLHTLIMPLIDNSDYRDLSAYFGGGDSPIDFMFDAERVGAVNVAANFSIDNFLLKIAGNRVSEEIEGETDAERTARRLRKAENDISESLFKEPLAEGERLLDFIGDEIVFGVGEDNAFSMSNIADVDVWLGLKLNDRERAEAFFKKLWQRISSEFGGLGMGFFQLSSSEPLSNEYNGQQFFMLPTGYVNIYYVFYDDAFYLTISQLAMNRLIDAHLDGDTSTLPTTIERGFAHTGTSHDIVAALDFEKAAGFEIGQEVNYWGQRTPQQFRTFSASLSEGMTLAKILPDYDGTLSNVSTYYRELPLSFYGARVESRNGELFLGAGDQSESFSDLSADSRGQKLLALVQVSMPIETFRERLRAFRSAVLGLAFIPEGLEVKIAIGNPNVTKPDARFSFEKAAATSGTSGSGNLIWIALAIGLFLLTFLFFRSRKPV